MLSLFGPNSCSKIEDEDFGDGMVFHYKEKRDGKPAIHPFSITHPHILTLASSPNGIYTSKAFAANFKAFGNEDKDLGIGTSSEESSENSSSKSQRRKALDDENMKRRYEEGWRRSSQALANGSPCTFSPGLDIYGNIFEDFWNSADNINNSRRDNHERPRNEMYVERNEEPARNTRKKQNGNPYDQRSDKKLHYYEHNPKRKHSSESFDKEVPRKYVTTRRNIV